MVSHFTASDTALLGASIAVNLIVFNAETRSTGAIGRGELPLIQSHLQKVVAIPEVVTGSFAEGASLSGRSRRCSSRHAWGLSSSVSGQNKFSSPQRLPASFLLFPRNGVPRYANWLAFFGLLWYS